MLVALCEPPAQELRLGRNGAIPANRAVVVGARRRAAHLLVLTAVLFAGCAGTDLQLAAGEAADAAPTEAEPLPAPVPVVYADLDRDTLYGLLVAEMAGRRGQFGLATSRYLELARSTGDIGVAERATRMALVSGNDQASVDAASEWARLAPDNLDAASVHGALQLRLGRSDEAFDEFDRMLRLPDVEPRNAYGRITEVLGREQNREQAFAVMRRLVDARGGHPDARYALAQLATRVGDLPQAVTELRAIREAAPDDERSADLLARVLQSQGESEAALAVLNDYLARRPEAHGARMSYARLLVGQNRFDEASREFARVSRAQPDNADARYAYAIVLLQLEDHDGARKQFETLAQSGKREQSSWYYLGQIAELQEDSEAALAAYRRVDMGEFRLNAQIRVAALLALDGNLSGARAHLQDLRRQYPGDRVRLFRAEADLLVRAEQFDEGTAVYDRAIAQLPQNTDLLYARAMLAARQDKVEALERDLRDILSREPDNADALNALGYTLADQTDRLEEARDFIARALALKPDDHYVVDSMGWVLYRLGRNEEAVAHLERALELQADPEVAAHLGEVLWAMGRRDEARRVWGDALERDPEAEKVLETIRRLDAD